MYPSGTLLRALSNGLTFVRKCSSAQVDIFLPVRCPRSLQFWTPSLLMDWFWGTRRVSSPEADDTSAHDMPSTLLPPLENSTTCIRLLRIEQSTGPGYPVSCSLRAYNLEDSPLYTAVSYVWGSSRTDDQDALEILINGVPRSVRFNLYAFVRYASISGSLRSWC